jgi:hypothetical protein
MSNLAEIHEALGHQSVAFELRRATLALRKAKLGSDHPDTIWSMGTVAGSLIDLGRHLEAMSLIDDCLRRAAGRSVDPRLVPGLHEFRLRSFAKQRDGTGCRQTAESWEKLERKDAESLYRAAVFRSVTAGLLPAEARSDDARKAVEWLRCAVAAGYDRQRLLAQMTQDPDLAPLRGRDDFKLLMTDLAMPAQPFADC